MWERLSSDTNTNGGSSETDKNALAVIPCVLPFSSAVTTVTPVANRPNVFRSSRKLKPGFVTVGLRTESETFALQSQFLYRTSWARAAPE